MIEPKDRISPADAVTLVSRAAGLSTPQSQQEILGWIAGEFVSAMAMEVVRWEDSPRPDAPKPLVEINGHMVQPLGDIVPRWEWPMTRIVENDQGLSVQQWRGASLSQLWIQAEISVPIPNSGNPNARTDYAGVRFSRPDILRRLELAGHVQIESIAVSDAEIEAWCRAWLAQHGGRGGENAAWQDFHKNPRFARCSKHDVFRPVWRSVKAGISS